MTAAPGHESLRSDLAPAPGCFVIPNPWDMGSARMMAALGAKALATTSAGLRLHARAARHGPCQPRRGAGPCRRHRCGDAAAGIGRFRERLWRRSRRGGRDDTAGRRRRGYPAAPSRIRRWSTAIRAYDFDLAVERVKAAAARRARSGGHSFSVRAPTGVMNGAYDLDEAHQAHCRLSRRRGGPALSCRCLPDLDALGRGRCCRWQAGQRAGGRAVTDR